MSRRTHPLRCRSLTRTHQYLAMKTTLATPMTASCLAMILHRSLVFDGCTLAVSAARRQETFAQPSERA